MPYLAQFWRFSFFFDLFGSSQSDLVQSKEVDDIIIGAGCAHSFCASQNTVPSKVYHKLWFEMKSTTQWVGYFETISGHFFGNYINISHKTEVLIVVLMCLTYLNPYLIKNYDIKHNFCHFCFFQFCKKKNWKITTHKWPFYDHFWPFFCQFFTKLRFWWSF